MRLLLVEDDKMIGESLVQALKADGYTVDWAKDGDVAEESLAVQTYDLVLLDLGLPKQSGISVLQKLRAGKSTTPVIIITARDTLTDKVLGLDSGADDYIIKPFPLAELEARIRARLRRSSGNASPLIEAGALSLNPATREIIYKGIATPLSAKEYAILFALMEHPGRILSRADLEERLYGWDEEVSSNAVEVHIHQLRKKLDADAIRNVRGIGYMVAKV